MDSRIHNEPSNVTDEDGQVDQDGPDGVSVSYEPGAAIETGHRLIEKGLSAERQREKKGASEAER
jgi:hypothetical protein